MSTIAAGGIATLCDEICSQFQMPGVLGSVEEPQQSQFDLWMARVAMFLARRSAKCLVEEVHVGQNGLKKKVIAVEVVMCQGCLNQVPGIVSGLTNQYDTWKPKSYFCNSLTARESPAGS